VKKVTERICRITRQVISSLQAETVLVHVSTTRQ